MDNSTAFYQDIMSQQFSIGTFFNPTRFIILYGMLQKGNLKKLYDKQSLLEYVFFAYCDNKQLSMHHPKIEIRHAPYYGISFLYDEIDKALYEWVHDAKNNILSYDAKNIYLDIDDNGEVSSYIEKILAVLFVKHFGQEYKGIKDISNVISMDDLKLDEFGKSLLRDRVFADMQYCAVCDACNVDDLYVVHIIKRSQTNNQETLQDKNNGLLMCRKHAEAYNNNCFCFDDRGRVVNFDYQEDLTGLRIANRLVQLKKEYLSKEYNRILNDKK